MKQISTSPLWLQFVKLTIDRFAVALRLSVLAGIGVLTARLFPACILASQQFTEAIYKKMRIDFFEDVLVWGFLSALLLALIIYLTQKEQQLKVVKKELDNEIINHKQTEAALQQAQAALQKAHQEREVRFGREGTDASISPLKDQAGIIRAGMTVFLDVTDRQREEEVLRLSEERFRRAVLNAPIPVMIHAEDGKVIQISQTWTDLTSYTHSDIPTIAEWIEKAYVEETKQLVKDAINRLYHSNTRVEEGEFHIITKSGQTRIWDFSSAPLGQLPDGRRLVMSTAKDITFRVQMEEKLFDALQRLTFHVENSSLAVIEWNHNLQVSRWSPAAEKIFGWTADQVLGKHPSDWQFICEEDAEAVNGVLASLLNGSERRTVLLNRNYRSDGSIIHCEWYSSALLDESGNLVSVLSLVLDVSDRISAESALRQSEERYRSLVEATTQWVWIKDAQGEPLDPSLSWYTLTGQTQEDCQHWGWLDAIHPDDRDRTTQKWTQAVETKSIYETEYRVRMIEGNYRHYLVRGVPVLEPDGRIREWVGTSTDITKRKQAEAALQQLQNHFQAILDNSPMPIYLKDVQGRYILYNHQCEILNGLTSEQVKGKTDYELFPPQVAEALWANDQQVLAARTSLQFEEVTEFERELHTYISIKFPLYDSAGVLYAVCGISTDITESKRMEEQIRESEQNFRQLAENISQLFYLYSADQSQSLYISPAYENIWGRSCQSLYEQPTSWLDAVHPEDYQHVIAARKKRLRGEGYVNEEFRIVRPDGSIRWISSHTFPILNEAGKVYRLGGIAEDITERKQIEAELRASEERFRTSVENMLDCFAIFTSIRDRSGRITDFRFEYVNPAACIHNLMTKEQQIGKKMCELLPAHREIGLFDEYVKVVETGEPFVQESLAYEEVFNQHRLSRVFDVRAVKLGDGFVVAWRDITRRKRAEAEVLKALERERELNEFKSRIISVISHEYRTPLTTIQLSAGLLESYGHKWTEEKKNTHFQRIQTAVARLTQIVSDVLVVGEAEARELRFQPAPLDIEEFCRDLVEELQVNAGNKHTLTFISQGCGTKACLDERLLRQILTNLLTNAVKYSPQGGNVNFELTCDQETAIFRIQDEGIGIPVPNQEKLFTSFYRATNVGTISGTGLGLSIVKNFVALHGGKITFVSDVDVGTTFIVTLPLNKQMPIDEKNAGN